MNKVEEALQISRETKFATLGRAIADAYRSENDTTQLISEAMRLRYMEQESAEKLVAFAGMARQIGDAARNGKDLTALLERIVELRRHELGPIPPPPPKA